MTTQAAIEDVFRAEHGKVLAFLLRALGDLSAAEDALQDAFVAALAAWPREGIPARPAAWITTVARNRGSSARRHERIAQRKHEVLLRDTVTAVPSIDDDDIPDERLRLVFLCCHPALSEEARVALTLHTTCGLTTAAIARLFLCPEPTVAQRIVRAKRKIAASRIPYEVPAPEAMDERVAGVLSVVYLLFTEGYASTEGESVVRAELCDEALRLGRVLRHLMPRQAEVLGLCALMTLHDARRAARTDAAGDILALDEQDRSLWDRAAIAEGTRTLDEALGLGAPGPYQIQAAIAALHVEAPAAASTDWPQIAALYERLYTELPSPAVALNLAVARGMATRPEEGLATLDGLLARGALSEGTLVTAARADLLRRAGRLAEARAAYEGAIAGARNVRQARFFERRMRACG